MIRHIISKYKFGFFILSSLMVLSGNAFSQRSQKYYETAESYRKALDLFEKEKYASAQSEFSEIIRYEKDNKSEISANSAYYKALCGLLLFNDNAENLLIEFITDYPESPKVNRAYFDLGKFQYRKRKFAKAISWFESVNVYNLDNEEIAEYYFKLGYSYFKEGSNTEALKTLFEIKDAETKYSVVAKYYFAHLSYESGNFETSIKYFREIENDESFSPIVPYYISQILFRQAKYEELIAYALVLPDSGRAKRKHEIAKFIGESYFRLERYEESIPYLKTFAESAGSALPADYYQVATAYLKMKEYEQAVSWYQMAMSENDTLNQIIQYNLAEAYLALDKKRLARNAMRSAYLIDVDKEIKENALFSYAKLSYELSEYPFNDAVSAFEEYINTYPNSTQLEDANEYLVAVYFTTKNYEEARKSLDRITNRGLKLNIAYQKVLYYLGVEYMNRGVYEQAIAYFDLAIANDYERSVRINSIFWRAEAYFRLLHYDESIKSYNTFLTEAGSVSSEYYDLAQYNLGYGYFRTRDYKSAIFRFRQFIDNAGNSNIQLKNDAILRTADAYFITRDYSNAIEYYDKAVDLGQFDVDYALFQSALASGVIGLYDNKISKLTKLKNEHQSSLYLDDAIFELGDILFIKGETEGAQQQFERIIVEIGESPYVGRAMLKSGLIYYNLKRDSLALDRFKVVVSDYRNTSDAKQALDKIKQIYIDRGDLAGFEKYMGNLGGGSLPEFSLDSASYEIAENAYLNNNCEDAVKNFTMYLDKYEKGVFKINAHYYRGDCELRSGFKDEALLDFEFVISKPKNIFTEKSLLYAAEISREKKDFEKAIEYYKQLESKSDVKENLDQAHYWLLKLNFIKAEYKEALRYSELMLRKQKLNDEIRSEVLTYTGMSYLKLDMYNQSFNTYLGLLNSNDKYGAEGKYYLAYIEFMRGNLDSSEVYINLLLNQVPAYDYWIAKSFILWSDIYISRGDSYQAKVSLASVIDNSENAEVKKEAQDKLNAIKKLEEIEKERLKKEKKELEIEFMPEEDYDYLFDEEVIDEEN